MFTMLSLKVHNSRNLRRQECAASGQEQGKYEQENLVHDKRNKPTHHPNRHLLAKHTRRLSQEYGIRSILATLKTSQTTIGTLGKPRVSSVSSLLLQLVV
jgi:hypothetical protein